MKDAVKANINMLTALMVVFLTALFAVIGYTFDKRKVIDFTDWCIIFITMLALATAFYVCMILLKKDIKRLEKRK
ncbi:hypothetical protein ACWIUD_04925 [Helicobacter sp. 23-1044]